MDKCGFIYRIYILGNTRTLTTELSTHPRSLLSTYIHNTLHMCTLGNLINTYTRTLVWKVTCSVYSQCMYILHPTRVRKDGRTDR